MEPAHDEPDGAARAPEPPRRPRHVRAVPTNEWICVEWMVDSAKELTKFWWDGVEHPSLATTRDVPSSAMRPTFVFPLSSYWT